MLLPIVLLLASSASIQPTDSIVARRPLAPDQSQLPNHLDSSNGFVRRFGGNQPGADQGILIPRRNCSPQNCNSACMSITAYVFSDGEYPQLQYVTDCPNLDVPYQTERAHRNAPHRGSQPRLRHTDFRGTSSVWHKDVTAQ